MKATARLSVVIAGLSAASSLFLALPRSARAGATRGPAEDTNVVNEGMQRVYHISFRGGERAVIAAKGDGDIDMEVRDARGNLVASDREYDSNPVCVWTPIWTETFTVKVINAEHRSVYFALVTN